MDTTPQIITARLCPEAAHGDILVDERTIELLGTAEMRAALRPCAQLNLKGFRDPVPNYALASA